MQFVRLVATFLLEIITRRYLIWELAKGDFKVRYLGSYLGVVWAFAQPLITVALYWLVFSVGFKAGAVGHTPYVLWMIAGIVPWFFVNDALSSASGAILENAYLLKKVTFSIGILPMIKIVSAIFIHLFFMALVIVLFIVQGYAPGLIVLQLGYYTFCAVILIMGISWITSAVAVFIRDVTHVIAMLMQFLFWLSPVLWSPTSIPPQYLWLIKLNPIFYIVQGYRDTLIGNIWFWQKGLLSLYFWAVAMVLSVTGAMVFRKLRPNFADVI